MIGETLGNYRIVSKVGKGGMGAVYMAEHVMMERRAAIKVLLPAFSHQPAVVRRFFNEARASARLQHPALVSIYDCGHHAETGSAYLVMDYLEGESLTRRLRRVGKLPLEVAIDFARQIAAGMAVAHEGGIIHRDLKPGNIFLVPDREQGREVVRILDFGVAKLSALDAAAPALTAAGMVLGTPSYMAPEQARGATGIDARADVYALGCILFAMLCGRPPFTYRSPGELLMAHAREQPPAPRELDPSIPPALDREILKALAKDPARRHPDMRAFAMAVRRAGGAPPNTRPLPEVPDAIARAVSAQSPAGATAGAAEEPAEDRTHAEAPPAMGAAAASAPAGEDPWPTLPSLVPVVLSPPLIAEEVGRAPAAAASPADSVTAPVATAEPPEPPPTRPSPLLGRGRRSGERSPTAADHDEEHRKDRVHSAAAEPERATPRASSPVHHARPPGRPDLPPPRPAVPPSLVLEPPSVRSVLPSKASAEPSLQPKDPVVALGKGAATPPSIRPQYPAESSRAPQSVGAFPALGFEPAANPPSLRLDRAVAALPSLRIGGTSAPPAPSIEPPARWSPAAAAADGPGQRARPLRAPRQHGAGGAEAAAAGESVRGEAGANWRSPRVETRKPRVREGETTLGAAAGSTSGRPERARAASAPSLRAIAAVALFAAGAAALWRGLAPPDAMTPETALDHSISARPGPEWAPLPPRPAPVPSATPAGSDPTEPVVRPVTARLTEESSVKTPERKPTPRRPPRARKQRVRPHVLLPVPEETPASPDWEAAAPLPASFPSGPAGVGFELPAMPARLPVEAAAWNVTVGPAATASEEPASGQATLAVRVGGVPTPILE